MSEDEEDLQLSLVVAESLRQAQIDQQKLDDEEFLEDYYARRAMEESEAQQREQKSQDDEELARNYAMVDALVESAQHESRSAAAQLALQQNQERSSQERWNGSWDCPKCTLQNDPCHSPCKACETPAPGHVLVFNKVPPKMRFGVELELFVPGGRREGLSYPKIAKQLTKLGLNTTFDGYSHETKTVWKIVTDSSLQGRSIDLCMEIVSPVLSGEEGISEVRFMLESLRRIGIATNHSCGFHVHVDATDGEDQAVPQMGTVAGLRQIVQCFCAFEGAFDAIVATDQRHTGERYANRNRFCNSNVLPLGRLSRRQKHEKINKVTNCAELINLIQPGQDRYRKLNLTNTIMPNRPSTVEFRQHGGVDELMTAETWIRLILLFCYNAVSHRNIADICLLRENSSVPEELQALFGLVGCNGLRHFYSIDRSLYKVRTIEPAAWRCAVCSKGFSRCSDLARHASATGHRNR